MDEPADILDLATADILDLATLVPLAPSRSVHKVPALVPVSYETALDLGLITEEQARAQGWVPTPMPSVSRWNRLRWRWWAVRSRVGCKVGSWIAGVELCEDEGWDR